MARGKYWKLFIEKKEKEKKTPMKNWEKKGEKKEKRKGFLNLTKKVEKNKKNGDGLRPESGNWCWRDAFCFRERNIHMFMQPFSLKKKEKGRKKRKNLCRWNKRPLQKRKIKKKQRKKRNRCLIPEM